MAHIFNDSNGILMADRAGVADTFLTRLRGLLGRREFPVGEALVIRPCSSVHSIGMKIPIDVLFVSKNNEVLHIIQRMNPYRLSPVVKGAGYVVELPVGQVEATDTRVGHRIRLSHQ